MSTLDKQQLFLLLEKQRQGSCTPEEETLLQNWFEQVTIIEELTFIPEAEKEQIKADISEAIGARTGISALKRKKQQRFNLRKLFPAGIAALLVLGLMIAYFVRQAAPVKMILVAAPAGVKKMPVNLPDSSVVWLSGGSSIRFPEHFEKDARHVSLDGAAFFSVKHDKNAPFTVAAGKVLSVKVLGTSFVIEEKTDLIRVSVVTGKVQVNDSRQQLGLLLPGERLSYSGADKTFATGKYETAALKDWKIDDLMSLDDVSLSELGTILNALYGVKLSYDGQKIKEHRFHLSFSKKLTPDEVLDLLRTASDLNFERKGEEVKVSNR